LFRTANSTAREFTRPVVVSRREADGKCSASIGTFVIINQDGWFVTAYHMIEYMQKVIAEAQESEAFETEQARLKADASLDKRTRQKLIAALKWPGKDQPRKASVWWGADDVRVTAVKYIAAVDVAIGKLEGFDPSWIKTYPTFKDPSKGYEPGVSLCKLGCALHSITPQWDDTAQRFKFLPPDVPVPLFPIEGIFTRGVQLGMPGASPIPLEWIETSSPGLRGQSGGPTFDSQGTIWSIQVKTAHYALGFEGLGKDQYLNVGLGVSMTTLLPFLDDNKVAYNLSTY
jgi:S1-C subfamily serine protease